MVNRMLAKNKLISVVLVSFFSAFFGFMPAALALGVVAAYPMRTAGVHNAHKAYTHRPRHSWSKVRKSKRNIERAYRKAFKDKSHLPMPLPQNLVGKLADKPLAPGVTYRYFHGLLNINLIDVDVQRAPVQIRPIMAGESFCRLADVKCQIRQCQAIAAVNANYFKKDGTPLGTLIVDNEWVSGPIYDRVSLGITKSGFLRMDRVNLYGILSTSSPACPSIWVNNINQPRRSGSKLILYTSRWGKSVHMQYAGTMLAVSAEGQVVAKHANQLDIPAGGYVLCDRKISQISMLRIGDLVNLEWHTRPNNWGDVEQAVSGGPMLIKDGQLFVDTGAEGFKKAWTGRHIKARTAVGITANNHLLLLTIEGPHTLWDCAKLLDKLGAVDAMNLDGGGSTTMVVNGSTVTRNGKCSQRRVAASLAIIDSRNSQSVPTQVISSYVPSCDMTDFAQPDFANLDCDDMSLLPMPEPIEATLPEEEPLSTLPQNLPKG